MIPNDPYLTQKNKLHSITCTINYVSIPNNQKQRKFSNPNDKWKILHLKHLTQKMFCQTQKYSRRRDTSIKRLSRVLSFQLFSYSRHVGVASHLWELEQILLLSVILWIKGFFVLIQGSFTRFRFENRRINIQLLPILLIDIYFFKCICKKDRNILWCPYSNNLHLRVFDVRMCVNILEMFVLNDDNRKQRVGLLLLDYHIHFGIRTSNVWICSYLCLHKNDDNAV